MIESLLALLTFLVFGVLWLSTQSWFDLLPRRVARQAGLAGLLILTFAAYAAPTAFQAGVQRWTDHIVQQAQDKAQRLLDDFFTDLTDFPTSPPTPPTPAPDTTP